MRFPRQQRNVKLSLAWEQCRESLSDDIIGSLGCFSKILLTILLNWWTQISRSEPARYIVATSLLTCSEKNVDVCSDRLHKQSPNKAVTKVFDGMLNSSSSVVFFLVSHLNSLIEAPLNSIPTFLMGTTQKLQNFSQTFEGISVRIFK